MKRFILALSCAFIFTSALAEEQQPQEEGYKFTVTKEVPATSVKNQYRSGTCWSFAGNALLESELLRIGKGEYDLSEMWIVRHTYYDKAIKYARMHGAINFSAGGATHDVTNVIRDYGIVPEEAYPGLGYGLEMHDHMELDAVLEAYMNAIITNKGNRLTTAWKEGLNGILDAYFGPVPDRFTYNGKEYTPQSFAQMLTLDMNDYISLTSFTHHPFYSQFVIEVPDNWASGISYNVPLDELMQTMEHAIETGYSICWASDVSEKGFAWVKGFAVVPDVDLNSMEGTEQARWVTLTPREREAALYKLDKPGKERVIDQQMRQEAFDIYETTDDHGMQITGIAIDQEGNKYFRVKNSWGTNQVYDGYFYASYPFVAYKTMNIMLHKDALPKDLKAKLGL